MKLKFKIVIVFFVFYACNKKNNNHKNNEYEESTNTFSFYNEKFMDDVQIEKLKNAVQEKGDTLAFKELEEIYFNSGHRKEFLYYALFMSNAYNYKQAYYSVYRILHTDFGEEKYKYNDKLANYYLLKAYELGSKNAIYNIEERFPKSKIPSSKEYWKLIVK